ncbi:hypothetical protein [Planktothrix mougeotii]|uniref:Uncharacterized protein n=1 Tax=Planktothrix mougeotii LEGE 06226 TaxID=1828728 RepID=A0ABR9UEL2_9CYAN|nr:hypothetical protein [Planktothrix mougeotii]MBE9144907.1 hypothetical protein [Planktothrix mougeotii LEGE 06226]
MDYQDLSRGFGSKSSGKGFYSSKRNPCPICQKDHGCLISHSGRVVTCIRADSQWTINGWEYKKQARGGMGSVWGIDSGNQNKTEYRPQIEKTTKPSNLKPLTDEQLDTEARKIQKQLGLNTRHRKALRGRGLSDSQIDSIGSVSVDRYQEFNSIPINPSFPGMGDRGTLTNGDSGFIVFTRNIKGQITGGQVATDHRGELDKKGKEIPKYPWLTGCSERRVSKERPLQFLKLNNSRILDIIEGTLKPLIAAHLHNINVLGSGGTAWHGSPNEFKEIIDSGLFDTYILNPDTGCKFNHHVMYAYRESFLFLKKHGITLCVRDWGQEDKPKSDKIDVDEIDTITFNNARIIPFEEWDNSDELKAFLAQQSSRKNNDLISKDEWDRRFKQPQLEKDLVNVVKRFYGRFNRKTKPVNPTTKPVETVQQTTVNSSAIVLWKPQPLTTLSYIPGQLPMVEEWQQMGCPKIFFNEGQRRKLFAEARERGFKFSLDTTPAGYGKSHESGLINLQTFGIDPNDKDNKTRIFYLSPDHRNPTTETVEINYVDHEARHPGLNYDYSRTTAMGNPHVVRAKPNQTPDIPSNCPETNTFLTVADLGLSVYGGKDSPICQSCPLLFNGCTFLENRRHTLTNERLIRADINSISPASDDILTLDDLSLVNTHQISVKIDDILKIVGKLKLRDDERIFKVLHPVLVAVYKALQTITTEKHKYGINHRDVMKLMPTIDELNQLIWELYADDWLKADNVWGTPIWHYEMINGEPTATKVIGEDFIAPSLIDLRNECYKIFENYAKFINGLQTPEEKQQAIKDNVIPSWLPALIDCLLGNERINLSIDNGKLTITKLSKRHRNIVKNAGFSIFLDATQSKQDLALSLGVSPDEILEVSEVKRPTPNLTIHIIDGLRASKQRRETMQDRIGFAQRAIAKRHQGQNIGLIDHKSAISEYDAQTVKLGYWYRDTRGSNRFLSTQVLTSIGSPIPNLGQVAGEYQTLTGYSPTPDKLTGHYGAWVKRKIQSELIQCVGRLRAHQRPSEELHCYLVADLDESTISAIRLAYPTATVITEDVYDIAPGAASKGTQTERGIIQALWESMKSGKTLTIEQVAEAIGKAKSTVTFTLKERLGIGFRDLKKSLVLLLEAIYSKTKLSELDDESRWIAEEYLPNIVSDLETGQITPVDVVSEIITTAKAFGERQFRRILATTPIPILCKLLGAVLRFIPPKLLSELLPISPQIETA